MDIPVLQSLSDNYKLDWGIVTTTATITLPNLFAGDGRGYFMRAVDGKTRQVGSIQQSANLAHSHYLFANTPGYATANSDITSTTTIHKQANRGTDEKYAMKASSSDATLGLSSSSGCSESNPLNIGMIPAIYLGV